MRLDSSMTDGKEPSWWVLRDIEGDALQVFDEEPEPEIIQAPNGVHTGKVESQGHNLFMVYERIWPKKKRSSTEQFGVGGEWVLIGTVSRITQVEYETYIEFGAFDELD